MFRQVRNGTFGMSTLDPKTGALGPGAFASARRSAPGTGCQAGTHIDSMLLRERAREPGIVYTPAAAPDLRASLPATQDVASTHTNDCRGLVDSSQPAGIRVGAALERDGIVLVTGNAVDLASRRYSIEMQSVDATVDVQPGGAPAGPSQGLAATGTAGGGVGHATNVQPDAASPSSGTCRSSMRTSHADLEECSCESAISNSVPAHVLAARSSDVMVVEWDGEESETSDVEQAETETVDGRVKQSAEAKEDDNENELMSQLLGLWRKLRIENAELRAQVRPITPHPQPAQLLGNRPRSSYAAR